MPRATCRRNGDAPKEVHATKSRVQEPLRDVQIWVTNEDIA